MKGCRRLPIGGTVTTELKLERDWPGDRFYAHDHAGSRPSAKSADRALSAGFDYPKVPRW